MPSLTSVASPRTRVTAEERSIKLPLSLKTIELTDSKSHQSPIPDCLCKSRRGRNEGEGVRNEGGREGESEERRREGERGERGGD